MKGIKKMKQFTISQKIYMGVKRVIDILLSALALILLSWLFLILCIAIKIDSRGPILFKQKRVGIHKTHFMIYKFRTMRIDTPKDMPTHMLADPEQYITRVGKFLRKSSLDELPQIINILMGKMSIVGPRPALWNQYDLIEERDNGKAVLVVSFELDEILDMSDRIAVIYDGAIQGILDPAETNKQDLGILMAGGQLNKEEANV